MEIPDFNSNKTHDQILADFVYSLPMGVRVTNFELTGRYNEALEVNIRLLVPDEYKPPRRN